MDSPGGQSPEPLHLRDEWQHCSRMVESRKSGNTRFSIRSHILWPFILEMGTQSSQRAHRRVQCAQRVCHRIRAVRSHRPPSGAPLPARGDSFSPTSHRLIIMVIIIIIPPHLAGISRATLWATYFLGTSCSEFLNALERSSMSLL